MVSARHWPRTSGYAFVERRVCVKPSWPGVSRLPTHWRLYRVRGELTNRGWVAGTRPAITERAMTERTDSAQAGAGGRSASRSRADSYDGRVVSDLSLRKQGFQWPPPETEGPIRGGNVAAPRKCRARPAWSRGHSSHDRSRDTPADTGGARPARRRDSVDPHRSDFLQEKDRDRRPKCR